MTKTMSKVIAALFGIVLLTTMAAGDTVSEGTIRLTITDESNKPVPQATIAVRDEARRVELGFTTDASGRSEIHLQPGSYALSVSARNKQGVVMKVTLNDRPLDLYLTLHPDSTNQYLMIAYLTHTLCGAVILLLLDLWLRRRSVKDPTLIWLCVSLLSWSVVRIMQLLALKGRASITREQLDLFSYFFSPVTSILFTMTAFRLSRFREIFREPPLRHWPMRIIIAVGAVSAVALVLSLFSLWENNVEVMAVANNIDAVASTLALIALGSGLVYSFHKYGNQFLVGLTVLTILPFIMRQYYVANNGSPKSVMLNAIFLADSTMLIMLFIALAVAWGLSDTARLRPTGTPVNVDVVTMFFDLRGSTHWANDVMEKDFRYVGKFIDSLREWSWKHAANLPQCPLKLVKFLGDGFMFIWEIPNGAKADSANGVVGMAHTLCTTYLAWVKETISEPHGAPDGIGAGIDVGPAIRLTLENGSEDYLGSPLNIAAKMQNLARPNGGIVIPSKVWELLNEHLRAKFPKAGVVKLGQSEIPVHMTSDVEL